MAMVFIFASKVQLSEVGRELQVDEKPTCLRMVLERLDGMDDHESDCDVIFSTPLQINMKHNHGGLEGHFLF